VLDISPTSHWLRLSLTYLSASSATAQIERNPNNNDNDKIQKKAVIHFPKLGGRTDGRSHRSLAFYPVNE